MQIKGTIGVQQDETLEVFKLTGSVFGSPNNTIRFEQKRNRTNNYVFTSEVFTFGELFSKEAKPLNVAFDCEILMLPKAWKIEKEFELTYDELDKVLGNRTAKWHVVHNSSKDVTVEFKVCRHKLSGLIKLNGIRIFVKISSGETLGKAEPIIATEPLPVAIAQEIC